MEGHGFKLLNICQEELKILLKIDIILLVEVYPSKVFFFY